MPGLLCRVFLCLSLAAAAILMLLILLSAPQRDPGLTLVTPQASMDGMMHSRASYAHRDADSDPHALMLLMLLHPGGQRGARQGASGRVPPIHPRNPITGP